jgi:ATP-dependent DNA helicase RecG
MKLDTPVSELPFVGPTYEKRLEKLEIKTVGDLLHHVPHRYQDFSLVTKIKNIQVGETVTIKGQVVEIKNQYTKQGKKIQTAKISDGASKINAIWFNQPFLVNSLPEGTLLSLAGKVGWWAGKPALVSPEYEKLTMEGTHTGRLVPVYHETAGVSSKWIRARIKAAFEKLAKDQLVEFLPAKIIKEANFLNFKQAIKAVHYPKSKNQAEAGRRRLAFT